MHPCLQLPEIVHTICTILDNSESATGALYAMSLTCRGFSNTALDCLWYELGSLKPMLYTFPVGLVKLDVPAWSHNFGCLLRDVTLDDVARFRLFYSPRIRKLRLERSSSREPSAEVLQALKDLNAGLLVPNLTCLHWYSEYLWEFEEVFPSISLFLGSKLKDVGVHIHPDNSAHRALLEAVANEHPDLEAMTITFGSPPPIEPWEVVSICQFNNLRSLAIPHLSTKSLEHVSRLPQLQSIMLSDSNPVDMPQDSQGSPQRFTSLRDFVVVTAGDLKQIFNLIQYLSPTSPLRRFSLTYAPAVPTPPLMRDWQQILRLIERHCNPDTLNRLELEDSDYMDPTVRLPSPTGPAEGDIEKIDIGPLFALKNLEALELSFAHGLSLTQTDLQRIPSHWKSISYMYLCPNYPSYNAPAITHEDVVALIKACPKLWGLGVIFDTSQIPETPDLLLAKPLKRFLRLKVGNSPIHSVDVMARFLGMHFPRLWQVWPCGHVEEFPDSEELSKKWVEVETRLKEAIVERREARARAALEGQKTDS